MVSVLRRTISLSATIAAVAFLAACGGDANEQGAATPDSAQPTVGAAAGDVNAASVNPQEAVAFMMAADSSEIQAAQVAMRKATEREVRQFAQKMQREHGQSARELSTLARQINAGNQPAGQQGQMVQNLQQMAQQMKQQLDSTPRGPQFDRAYIDGQVQAHQSVLENLQRIAGTTSATGTAGTSGTAATGTAPATGTAGATSTATPRSTGGAADTTQAPTSPQQAAQKMIPHVQQHLDEARRIQSKLSGSGGTR